MGVIQCFLWVSSCPGIRGRGDCGSNLLKPGSSHHPFLTQEAPSKTGLFDASISCTCLSPVLLSVPHPWLPGLHTPSLPFSPAYFSCIITCSCAILSARRDAWVTVTLEGEDPCSLGIVHPPVTSSGQPQAGVWGSTLFSSPGDRVPQKHAGQTQGTFSPLWCGRWFQWGSVWFLSPLPKGCLTVSGDTAGRWQGLLASSRGRPGMLPHFDCTG